MLVVPPRLSTSQIYTLAFTCGVCLGRNQKQVSKQAYHHGTVIIKCDSCAKRKSKLKNPISLAVHLVTDHLNWFENASSAKYKFADEVGDSFF